MTLLLAPLLLRDALKAQARRRVNEHSVTALDSLSWTEAQKRNIHQYEAEQKILFLRAGHGFAKNQTAEVVDEAGPQLNALRVKKEDGTMVDFNLSKISANNLVRKGTLANVRSLDTRYAQVNQKPPFIARIKITPVKEG